MGLLKKNDECLILHSEMMKYIHLACSEAFDVQLQDCWPLELADGVPRQGHIASPWKRRLPSSRPWLNIQVRGCPSVELQLGNWKASSFHLNILQ